MESLVERMHGKTKDDMPVACLAGLFLSTRCFLSHPKNRNLQFANFHPQFLNLVTKAFGAAS